MKKIVKKFGNSLVIVITKEDARIYDIQEGDIIDIEEMYITRKKINKKRKNKK